MTTDGLITSALGGFYYVKTADGTLYECRARGLFRKEGISPLTGDTVTIQITGQGSGFVEEIASRKNFMLRPPVANVARLVMVVSIVSPPPNLLILDKLLAIAQFKEIEPVVVVTKTDLGQQERVQRLCALYRDAGFSVFALSSRTQQGVEALHAALDGGINCFCGNTGAGKSSLLNAIDPTLSLKTGEISKKLGRGRHTTRHAQLYELPGGGYIADTPGFSAVEISRYEVILKDRLQYCFREFAPYIESCRFRGCSHTCEAGCAVLKAEHAGKIAPSRMESYRCLYEDAKKIKEWELEKS